MSNLYKRVFKAWILFERGSQCTIQSLVGVGRLDSKDTSAGLKVRLLRKVRLMSCPLIQAYTVFNVYL